MGLHVSRDFQFEDFLIYITCTTHNFQISELKTQVESLKRLLESAELKQVDKEVLSESKVCTLIPRANVLYCCLFCNSVPMITIST